MALIHCPDCNHQASGTASACPQCGRSRYDVSRAARSVLKRPDLSAEFWENTDKVHRAAVAAWARLRLLCAFVAAVAVTTWNHGLNAIRYAIARRKRRSLEADAALRTHDAALAALKAQLWPVSRDLRLRLACGYGSVTVLLFVAFCGLFLSGSPRPADSPQTREYLVRLTEESGIDDSWARHFLGWAHYFRAANLLPLARFDDLALPEELRPAWDRMVELLDPSRGFEGNLAEARKLFDQAIEMGNGRSMHLRAVMIFAGDGDKDDRLSDAYRLIRRSAETGDAAGQAWLGWMYGFGQGVETDPEKAWELVNSAHAAGYNEAEYLIGAFHEFGGGVEADDEEAIRHYFAAARQRSGRASLELGKRFRTGRGVARDYQKAEETLRWIATSVAAANVELARMHFRGEGVSQDDAAAVKLLYRAARSNSLEAWELLIWAAHNDRGVEKKMLVPLCREYVRALATPDRIDEWVERYRTAKPVDPGSFLRWVKRARLEIDAAPELTAHVSEAQLRRIASDALTQHGIEIDPQVPVTMTVKLHADLRAGSPANTIWLTLRAKMLAPVLRRDQFVNVEIEPFLMNVQIPINLRFNNGTLTTELRKAFRHIDSPAARRPVTVQQQPVMWPLEQQRQAFLSYHFCKNVGRRTAMDLPPLDSIGFAPGGFVLRGDAGKLTSVAAIRQAWEEDLRERGISVDADSPCMLGSDLLAQRLQVGGVWTWRMLATAAIQQRGVVVEMGDEMVCLNPRLASASKEGHMVSDEARRSTDADLVLSAVRRRMMTVIEFHRGEESRALYDKQQIDLDGPSVMMELRETPDDGGR